MDIVFNLWFVEYVVVVMCCKVGVVGGVFYGEDGGGFFG